MPIAIPIPNPCQEITLGQETQFTAGLGPTVVMFLLNPTNNWFQKGSNIRFDLAGNVPMRLGIYGPNPLSIGAAGRMCAPKAGQPEAAITSCQGNFAPGRYYCVVRSHDNGPPGADFRLTTKVSGWKVFS